MSAITFTGQTFLVGYNMSLHLMGKKATASRLDDEDQNALMDFLDALDEMNGGRDRWIDATPVDDDGFQGICAVTGRWSATLQRVALISWTEVES